MQHFIQKLSLPHSRRPIDLKHANTSACPHSYKHKNSALIQLNVIHLFISRSVCETQRDSLCHSPCCTCIFLSETCCFSVAVDNGCLASATTVVPSTSPPSDLSFPLSPLNSQKTHHSALCPYDEFQRCTVGYSSCRGTVTPTEPQRGCRRILHMGLDRTTELTCLWVCDVFRRITALKGIRVRGVCRSDCSVMVGEREHCNCGNVCAACLLQESEKGRTGS